MSEQVGRLVGRWQIDQSGLRRGLRESTRILTRWKRQNSPLEIETTLDTSSLQRSLSGLTRSLQQWKARNSPVEVEVSLDDSSLRNGLRRASAELARFSRQASATASLEVDADTSRARRSIQDISARLTRLSQSEANLSVDADTSAADRAIRGVSQRLARLSGSEANIEITADNRDALARIGIVASRLRQLAGSDARVQVVADISEAMRRLSVVGQRLRQLSGSESTIGVDADISQAMAGLSTVSGRVRALSGEAASVRVDADTSSALQRIATVRGALASLSREAASVRVDADTSRALSGIASVRAALSALSREAANVSVNVTASMVDAYAAVERFLGWVREQRADIRIGAITSEGQLAADSLRTYISQLRSDIDVGANVGGALSSSTVAATRINAMDADIGVGADISEVYPRAQTAAEQVRRMTADINVGADTGAARAELAGFNQVMNRYGQSWGGRGIRARVQADTVAAQAQLRNLQRIAMEVEGDYKIEVDAQTAMATGRLAALSSMASALGMQRPTISVGVRGVAASTAQMLGLQALADRLDGYNVRVGASIDQSLSQALPNILGALEQQIARFQTVARAASAVTVPVMYTAFAMLPAVITQVAGVVGALAVELGAGLVGAVGTFSAAAITGAGALGVYGLALRKTAQYAFNLSGMLIDQKLRVDDANEAVTFARGAVEDATPGTREYANAVRGVALAQQTAEYETRKFNAILEATTPEMMALNKSAGDLNIEFVRLGGAVANVVAPAMTWWIEGLIMNLERLRPHILGMVRDMTAATNRFVRIMSIGQNLTSLTTIFQGIRDAGVDALSTLLNLVRTFVNVFATTIPAGVRLWQVLQDVTQATAVWSASAEGQRQIGRVWDSLYASASQLWSIVRDLGIALGGVILALNASGVGQGIMTGLAGVAAGFRDVMSSSGSGRQAIIDFMATTEPVLSALWSLVKGVGEQFGLMAVEVAKSGLIVDVINALNDALLGTEDGVGVIGMLRHEFKEIGPLLPDLITNLGNWFSIFAMAEPEMVLFIKTFNELLEAFNSLPEPIKRGIARTAAWGFALQALGITGVISSIIQMRFALTAFNLATGKSITMFKILKTALAPVGQFFSTIGRAVMTVARPLGQVLMPALRFLVSPIGTLVRFLPILAGAFAAISAPVWVVVAAVAALAAGAYLIYDNWGTIGPWLSQQWEYLKARTELVWTAIKAALSIVGEWVQSTFGPIWGRISEYISNSWTRLQSLAGTIWNGIKTVILGVGTAVSGAAGAVWGAVTSVISTAWNGLKSLAATVWNGIKTVILGMWNSLPAPVQGSLSRIGQVIQTGWNAVRNIVSTVLSGIASTVGSIWSTIVATVGNNLAIIQTTVSRAWSIIRQTTSAVWNGIKMFLGGVWTAVKGFWKGDLDQLQAGVAQAWAGIQRAATAAWNGIRAFFSVVWQGIRAVFTNNLSGLGSIVSTAWNGIRSLTSTIWQGIRTGIQTVWTGIRSAVSAGANAVSSVVSAAWNGLRSLTSAAWNGIRSVVQSVWTGIRSVASAGANAVRSVVSAAWNGLRSVTSSAWQGIRSVIQTVWQGIRSVASSGVAAVRSVVSGGWNALRSLTSSVWQGIRQVISSVWQGIRSVASSGVAAVRSVVTTGWNNLRNNTQSVWNAIRSFFQSVWNGIQSIFRSVVAAVLRFVRDSWLSLDRNTRSVYNGIRGFFQNIWNTIQGIFRSVVQAILRFVRDSWLSLRQNTTDAWNRIRDTIRDRITAARDRAVSTAQNLRERATSIFNALRDGVRDRFTAIRDWITGTIDRARNRAVETMENLRTRVERIASALRDGIRGIFTNIRDWMTGPIERARDTLKSVWNSILDGIAKVLGAVGLKAAGDKVRGARWATGGTTEDSGSVSAFARGGLAAPDVQTFAEGGMGTAGKNPRMHLWNEQQGGEAFIAEKRPAKEQLPYLQTAADWHGYAVVPANPAKKKIAPHATHFADGGSASEAPPVGTPILVNAFAGGGPGAMYQAVLSKFGVKGFNNHGSYLSGAAARDSLDFAPVPLGTRATGSGKELGDRIAAFTAPPSAVNTIWYGRANFGSGWQGYNTGPGVGNSNTLGHYDHVHAQAFPGSFRGGQGTMPGGGGGGGILQSLWETTANKIWDESVQRIYDNRVKKPLSTGHVIKQGATGAGQMVLDAIKDYIIKNSADDPNSGGGSMNAGSGKDVREWVTKGLKVDNLFPANERNISGYMSLANKESTGNPRAVQQITDINSGMSGAGGFPNNLARGLMQNTPQSWEGNRRKYGGDPGKANPNIFDPVKSVAVRARNQMAALGRISFSPGYAQGGIIPGSPGKEVLIQAHAGERVLPREVVAAFDRFAASMQTWGKVTLPVEAVSALDRLATSLPVWRAPAAVTRERGAPEASGTSARVEAKLEEANRRIEEQTQVLAALLSNMPERTGREVRDSVNSNLKNSRETQRSVAEGQSRQQSRRSFAGQYTKVRQ